MMSDPSSLLQRWCDLLCQMLPNPGPGLVTILEQDSCGPVVASHQLTPDSTGPLLHAAASAISERRPITEGTVFAHPLRRDGELFAVVAIELPVADTQRPVVQHLLEWAERWLQLLLESGGDTGSTESSDLLPLLQEVLQASPLQAALLSLADRLARRFGCERVALGLRKGGRVSLGALSHGMQFDPRTELARSLSEAMNHAGQHIHVWPDSAAADNHPLADIDGERARCMAALGAAVVVICERDPANPFTEQEQADLEGIGRLLGPVLELKQAQSTLLPQRVRESADSLVTRLFGPGHQAFKMAAVGFLAVLLLLAVVPGSFRVSADATVEGLVQRAVVAPFDGFIAEAAHRAGDTVAQGDVIARMDDRELLLELRKSTSEEDKLDNEYRRALAAQDRSEARIVQARLAQVQAQTRLLREKLERIQLSAPLDGIIISGDLSRALGAPVERGEVLFEVAPLDEYRLVLHIEESQVAHVASGQNGLLTLTALPREQFPFVVEQLSPVFREVDGRVTYRAEARIQGESPALRPGMEGVGKVEIGKRSYAWILFHGLVDWLRLKLWLWLP